MELNKHNVIKGAVVTSKSRKVFDLQEKVTFKVARAANKVMIRNAVESIWDVKVDKVAVMNVKGEKRRHSGKAYVTKTYKKAIITLKQGYKIEMPWQQYDNVAESMPVANSESLEGS